jgi:hypothetical protein
MRLKSSDLTGCASSRAPRAEHASRRRSSLARGLALLVVAILSLTAVASASATIETSGPGPVHTWTDYHTGMGTQGPSVPDNSTIQIACRVEGLVVQDGNPWWYRIASSPWNSAFYGSADAFYNNGRTSGSLKGTPFVDPAVPLCIAPAPAVSTGGAGGISQTGATLTGSVNPQGGNVTGCTFEYGPSPSLGSSVPCSSGPGGGTSPVGVSAAVGGLSANTTYFYRLVASNEGGTGAGGIQAFATLPERPVVVTEAASAVSQSEATLNASVDPEGGTLSSCELEYGPSPALGSSVPCSPSPGAASEPVAVSASVAALSANTTYYFRVVATNAGGTAFGSELTFATLPEAPAILAGPVSALGQVSATLNATVDPNEGAVSDCRFEYGTSEAYGSSAPCSPEPGAGASPVEVDAPLTGLTPGTTYDYRVVATNPGGTTETANATFTTAAHVLPELGRCQPAAGSSGRYKTAACTTESAGGDTGKYEWTPWPAGNDVFSGAGGSVKLETTGKAIVSCTGVSLTGEYTGSQSATAAIVFSGCEAPGALGGKCQSEGATAGEIVTSPLAGTLGIVKAAKKPTVGWDLTPVSPAADFADFRCGASAVSLTGSVIAPVTAVDKMSASFALKLKAAKGKQNPTGLEGEPSDTLAFVSSGREEQAGLTATIDVGNAEALEIKAIE